MSTEIDFGGYVGPADRDAVRAWADDRRRRFEEVPQGDGIAVRLGSGGSRSAPSSRPDEETVALAKFVQDASGEQQPSPYLNLIGVTADMKEAGTAATRRSPVALLSRAAGAVSDSIRCMLQGIGFGGDR